MSIVVDMDAIGTICRFEELRIEWMNQPINQSFMIITYFDTNTVLALVDRERWKVPTILLLLQRVRTAHNALFATRIIVALTF